MSITGLYFGGKLRGGWYDSATDGVGALFDISCLSGQAEFSNIQEDAYNIWSTFSGSDPSDPTITQQLNQKFQIGFLGTQSFADQGGSGLFSVFNFTQGSTSSGWINANAGDISNLNAAYSQQGMIDVPSKDSSADIDWQQLRKASGTLPNTLYRLNTVQGTSADSTSVRSRYVPILFDQLDFLFQ